jgi:hypothetical protein
MKVEILYFDGCPAYVAAEKVVHEVLEERGMDAEVELVAVNTDEEAYRFRFPGSSTLRVEGQDLFPTGEREDWQLGCRVYATSEGLKGYPTAEMLRAALAEKEEAYTNSNL